MRRTSAGQEENDPADFWWHPAHEYGSVEPLIDGREVPKKESLGNAPHST
jgi:hypothetical protein